MTPTVAFVAQSYFGAHHTEPSGGPARQCLTFLHGSAGCAGNRWGKLQRTPVRSVAMLGVRQLGEEPLCLGRRKPLFEQRQVDLLFFCEMHLDQCVQAVEDAS